MRKWIAGVLTALFVWVCMLLAQPVTVSGALGPYVQFVTASGWIAVFCIVAFLAYVVFTAKKR